MTVVFSNTGDTDTRVLAALWDGIPDARVLRSLRVKKRLSGGRSMASANSA